MPIALERQRLQLALTVLLRDIECDPAVVPHVGWNRVAGVVGHEKLRVHAHPESNLPAFFVTIRLREYLLAGTPYRLAELQAFGGVGQRQADLPHALENTFPAR